MNRTCGNVAILFLIVIALALPVSAVDTVRTPPPLQTVPVPLTRIMPPQPPQGSIKITYPLWPNDINIYPGGAYRCTWTAINVPAVNVTLVNTGTGQVFPLGSMVTTGQLTGIIPPTATPIANYEMRVTSASDARVEASTKVYMQEPRVAFDTPSNSVWPPNTLQTVEWHYYGSTFPVSLAIEGIEDGYRYGITVPTSQIWNGKGWTRLTIPNIPVTPGRFNHYVFRAYRVGDNKNVGTSSYFFLQEKPAKNY